MLAITDCTLHAELDAYAKGHPPFANLVTHFGRLLGAQRTVSAALSIALPVTELVDEEVFLAGEPLGARLDPALFLPFIRQAARELWPFMGEEFPLFHDSLNRLSERLTQDRWCMDCLSAIVRGDVEALNRGAALADVEPAFLLFALRAAYSPCIAALRPKLAVLPLVTLWRKCFCPICGSDPDMETLELHSDENEYVVSQSGEAWLHCPQCHQHWRFARAVCPSCGSQENASLMRFSFPEAPHESLYACDACLCYLPCLDLTGLPERERTPDLAYAALKLVHLDAVAQKHGYSPLSPVPWTAFNFCAETESA